MPGSICGKQILYGIGTLNGDLGASKASYLTAWLVGSLGLVYSSTPTALFVKVDRPMLHMWCKKSQCIDIVMDKGVSGHGH